MQSPETVIVTTSHVACDGGKGSLGHPMVYLEMGGKAAITCPYCSKTFQLSQKKEGKTGA